MLVDVTVRGGGGHREQPPGPFSIHDGGPLYRLGHALGHHHLGITLVLIAWAPLLIIAVVTSVGTGRLDPRFMDWAIQVRLLVAVPLLMAADLLLGILTRRAMPRTAITDPMSRRSMSSPSRAASCRSTSDDITIVRQRWSR